MTKKNPVKKATKKLVEKKAPKGGENSIADVAKVIAAATTLPTPPPDAEDRYQTCATEIAEVLRKHRCRIVAALSPPEAVGGEPTNKMLISATWGIMPES